jgi:hypothetical protein
MSATTEKLIEEISDLEKQISSEPRGSRNLVMLQEQLISLRKQLNQANEALNEGKQLLKD